MYRAHKISLSLAHVTGRPEKVERQQMSRQYTMFFRYKILGDCNIYLSVRISSSVTMRMNHGSMCTMNHVLMC
eukprot:COSAG01_NODE_1501_length_10094_cov_5.987113_8_plen_73_part_00